MGTWRNTLSHIVFGPFYASNCAVWKGNAEESYRFWMWKQAVRFLSMQLPFWTLQKRCKKRACLKFCCMLEVGKREEEGGNKHLGANHNLTQLQIFELWFAKSVTDLDTCGLSKTYDDQIFALTMTTKVMKGIKMERKHYILLLPEPSRILSAENLLQEQHRTAALPNAG